MVENSCGGRLSTTYHPRSSRECAAVVRPAPDMPVIIRTSAVSGFTGCSSELMIVAYPVLSTRIGQPKYRRWPVRAWDRHPKRLEIGRASCRERVSGSEPEVRVREGG